MGVGLALRRRDEEEQRGRLAVGGVVVDARGHRHGREPRRGDGRGLGVRDGDAVAQTGGELRLALAHRRGVPRSVDDVALGGHEVHELVYGLVLACRRTPDPDALDPQQIRDSHLLVLSPLFFRKVVPTPGARAWLSCRYRLTFDSFTEAPGEKNSAASSCRASFSASCPKRRSSSRPAPRRNGRPTPRAGPPPRHGSPGSRRTRSPSPLPGPCGRPPRSFRSRRGRPGIPPRRSRRRPRS